MFVAGAELNDDDITLLPAMDFRRWPEDGFFETKMSLVDALSYAHADERGAVLLDLAEIYLSHMLTAEAQSLVEGAKEGGWMDTDRYVALHDAVTLLRGGLVEEIETSPLAAEDRPDHGLWLSLNAIAAGDAKTLSDNLPGALIGLSYQNGPVARALLPLVTEAAIGLQNTVLSEAALSLVGAVPELAEEPAGLYLRGRHQANIGNFKSALEDYFEASAGRDSYAARARVALADLALEDGTQGALLAARDVLSAGAGAWRDDRLEIAALERAATVSARLGDPFAALLAFRRILIRYPDSDAADDALRQATAHLETIYRRGETGVIDLTEWFDLHQILLPTYRYLPRFPEFNEILADKVFEMGSAYLAIAEYRQTLGIYDNWPSALGIDAPPEVIDRLRYKLAMALERAQDWEGALDVLDQIDVTVDAELRNKVNQIRLKALSELEDHDNLLRTFVSEPDAESLRSWSRALFVRQDWEGAKEQYLRLFDSYPDQFRLSDASYLLIAAHRTNDDALGRRVALAFPQLSESEGISSLAARFLEDPTPLMPLRGEMTDDRLGSVADVMTILEESGL